MIISLFQFLDYLQNSGIDVYSAVNLLHELLGLPTLTPPSTRVQRADLGGLKGFLQALLALLPEEDIKALYYEKLESSPEFASFIEKLKSDDFKVIVDTLVNDEQFQDLIERARAKGVDVDAVVEFLNKLFGWF